MIRSLTLFIDVQTWSVDAIVEKTFRILSRVLDTVRNSSLDIWTYRVVLPPIPTNKTIDFCIDLVTALDRELPDSVLIQALPLEENSPCISVIPKILTEHGRVYSCIRCTSDECIARGLELLREFPRDDLSTYMRFAIGVGPWITTPYFPFTANSTSIDGYAISFRYIDLVERTLVQGNIEDLSRYLTEIDSKFNSLSRDLGIAYLGIDLSISPWRDESVAMLIEKLINARFGDAGTANAIYALNRFIRGIVMKLNLRAIGFNEVMLVPIEDSILSKRILENKLRFRDFMYWTLFCVAGIDGIAVDKTFQDKIHRVAIDISTIFNMKRRPFGIRLIYTDLEEGTRISIANYGETYVISF